MSRLPIPGSDKGTWGDVLNDFLLQSHAADGTLKAGVVSGSNLDTAAQASLANADASVLTINGKTPISGAVTIDASDVGAPTTLAGDTDVSLSALANGHLLTYDATTSKWKNKVQTTTVINNAAGLAGDGITDDATTIQTVLNNLGTSAHTNDVTVDAGSEGSVVY